MKIKLIKRDDSFFIDYLVMNGLSIDKEYEVKEEFPNYVTIEGNTVLLLREFIEEVKEIKEEPVVEKKSIFGKKKSKN